MMGDLDVKKMWMPYVNERARSDSEGRTAVCGGMKSFCVSEWETEGVWMNQRRGRMWELPL